MNRKSLILLAVALVALWWFGRGDSEQAALADGAADMAEPQAPAGPVAMRPTPSVAPVWLSAAVVETSTKFSNGAFSGRVLSFGNGHAVAGAEVTFAYSGGTATVVTNQNGLFRFEPFASGKYSLAVVQADGFLPYAPEFERSPIELLARPDRHVKGITIFVTPAIDYTGVVVDEHNAPVAGATIKLLDDASGESVLVPIKSNFVSDNNGEFVFHARDNSMFEAHHKTAGFGRAGLGTAAQISHRLKIRLSNKLIEKGTLKLEGRVTDAGSAPIADARVRLGGQMHGGATASRVLAVVTDAGGRFVFEDMKAGRYNLAATADGYSPGTTVAVAGEDDATIKLHRGAVIRGRVLSASSGDPVPAFTVVVLRKAGPLRDVTLVAKSIFDAEGRFEIDDLPERDLIVVAQAYGYARSAHTNTKAVRLPDSPTEVVLRLGMGGTLVGKVSDAKSKEPIENARVVVEGSVGSGTSAVPLAVTAVTDERGEFELAGLVPGLRSVNIASSGYHSQIRSRLQVQEGITLGPLLVAMNPTEDGEEPKLELAGLGVALAASGDGLRVQRVIPGGGGEEVGLLVGDVIVQVDGKNVVDLGFNGTIQQIRGPVGTTVSLRVRRTDGNVIDVVATRKKIRA